MIPIYVEEDGYYEIDFRSGASCSWTGTQDLYLDGELFLEGMNFSNRAADEFVSTLGHDKFLTQGDHVLTLKSTGVKAGNCYYYTDYVAFKPVTSVSSEGLTYTVTALFDKPVTGSVFAAAYTKENRLIALGKADVENATKQAVTFTLPENESVRCIKVYAWDANLRPLTVRQDIFYTPVENTPFKGDEEINIVYIGGSLTQGANSTFGGWTAKLSEDFKTEFGEENVNTYNVGIGGTTSRYGAYRLAEDVISKNPDMVFIEFVLNDNQLGMMSAEYMERMVKTLLTLDEVPYINFVYTKYPGADHIVPHFHTLVARKYGIPEIYVKGSYVDDATEATYYDADDNVHPNDIGYTAWYNEIKKAMDTDTCYQKPVMANTPVWADSGVLKATVLDKSTFEKTGAWSEKAGNATGERWVTSNKIWSETAGDTLSFTFTGNALGIIISGNAAYGNYEVIIDGESRGIFSGTGVSWDQEGAFFEDLTNGEHRVTIKVVERTGEVTDTDGNTTTQTLGTYLCIEDVFAGTIMK